MDPPCYIEPTGDDSPSRTDDIPSYSHTIDLTDDSFSPKSVISKRRFHDKTQAILIKSPSVFGFEWSNSSCYFDSYFTIIFHEWCQNGEPFRSRFSAAYKNCSDCFIRLLLREPNCKDSFLRGLCEMGLIRWGELNSIQNLLNSFQPCVQSSSHGLFLTSKYSYAADILSETIMKPYCEFPISLNSLKLFTLQDYVDSYIYKGMWKFYLRPDSLYLHLIVHQPPEHTLRKFCTPLYFVNRIVTFPTVQERNFKEMEVFGAVYGNNSHFISRFKYRNCVYTYDGMLNNESGVAFCTIVEDENPFRFVICHQSSLYNLTLVILKCPEELAHIGDGGDSSSR